ncbi:unnamed protein product [Linum trigynum]|uniref:Uncharacterized protein n=1 Tax=Linum trigynum TaxID=586398 RepID=A0AAV2FQE8_9ROSI
MLNLHLPIKSLQAPFSLKSIGSPKLEFRLRKLGLLLPRLSLRWGSCEVKERKKVERATGHEESGVGKAVIVVEGWLREMFLEMFQAISLMCGYCIGHG